MRYLQFILIFFTAVYANDASVQQLFSVQSVKVKKVTQAKRIKSFGFVKADDARVYDVAPRFGGYVDVLYADKIYKEVKKDEVLAKVYSGEVLKAKDDYLSTIKYNLQKSNTTMLASAKQRLELLEIPHTEIDTIQNSLRTSPYTDILSPASGFIFKKMLHNKSAFNAKQKLFEIVNLDTVWVELKIHQKQLRGLKNIQSFTLQTPAYERMFKAKKVGIYPQLNPKEEAFTLRLEVQNKEHLLLPGMYMSAVLSSQQETYLTLPSTAVIRKNGKFYVFIVGEYEGEYEPKEIQVEVLNPNTYIITNGLHEGDTVVNNALFMMDSDAQINGMWN